MSFRVFLYKAFYQLYNKRVQKATKNIGLIKLLKKLLFNKNGKLALHEVFIEKDYLPQGFKFTAPLKIAIKAQERGIENTMIRSINKCLSEKGQDCVCIDVGANFGFVSLALSRTISQQGKVYAFEPNTFVFQTLEKSIQLNHLENLVIPYRKAVGAETGLIKIHSRKTTSNILEQEDAQIETVEIISLDSVFEELDRLDLIKIDIDGLESAVLEGSRKIMKKFKPIVVFEANNEAPFNFFSNLNYNLYDLNLSPIEGIKKGANIFAIPFK